MSDEAALLAAIREHPGEDTPRLAFADWLDEQGGGANEARAEFIRLQIELARRGPYDTSAEAKELRARAGQLLIANYDRWVAEFAAAVPRPDLKPRFRRGFPDHLDVPARWLLEHGEAIRRTLPVLCSVSIYRLNGWGQRLARSPHLRGLRELRVACWFGAADGVALANSPHLGELERLTLWVGTWGAEGEALARTLGQSRAWPRLKRIELVWDETGLVADVVNQEAGRPLAAGVNPLDRTFPFAANFDHSFFVGRLADGRQVFAAYPWVGETAIPVAVFDAAGNQLEQVEVPVPPKDVLKERGKKEKHDAFERRRDAAFRRFGELVRARLGAEPADVRVRQFSMEYDGRFRCGVGDMSGHAHDAMYYADDPDEDPEQTVNGTVFGAGGDVEPWLGDHGSFVFVPGDGADSWYIGPDGRVEST